MACRALLLGCTDTALRCGGRGVGAEVGAVGAMGWFWLGAGCTAKILPFMGVEVVGGASPSDLARGDFGATVCRASSLLALSLAPLPSEGQCPC